MPVQNINIKIDLSIPLLHTLNEQNLCYSIRLRVTSLENNVIEAAILMVSGKDDGVFITRMTTVLSNYPFQFKSLQFIVSSCFAITINKLLG